MEKTEITEKNPQKIDQNALINLRTQFLIFGLFASVLLLQYLHSQGEMQKRAQLAQASIDVTQEKYAEAIDVFLPLALGGNVEAQTQLGFLYLKGKGFQKDKIAAAKWFTLAANQDQPEALYQVAKITESVSISNPKVFGYLTKASDLKNIPATFRLAQIWRDGEYAQKPDIKKAYDLFFKAALDGHERAMLEIARMNRDGLGVTKNAKTALEWLEKAAQKGNSDAVLDLAFLYHNGLGVAVDDNKAMMLAQKFIHDVSLQKAKDQDKGRAYILLGEIHEKGIGGVSDLSTALSWYEKAAVIQEASDDINLKLVRAYALGESVEQDLSKALSFFHKIGANPKFSDATTTSEFQKISTALKEMSARLPLSYAQEDVPTITTTQSSNPDSDPKTLFLLTLDTATLGIPSAQKQVAILYRDGQGTEVNKWEALKWFLAAAVPRGDVIQIPRATLDTVLKNTTELYMNLRAVPYYKNGESVGFKILSVKKDSFFDTYLKLKRGDVFKSINSIPLDIQSGLTVFEKIKTENHFEVAMTRQGQDINNIYEIIP